MVVGRRREGGIVVPSVVWWREQEVLISDSRLNSGPLWGVFLRVLGQLSFIIFLRRTAQICRTLVGGRIPPVPWYPCPSQEVGGCSHAGLGPLLLALCVCVCVVGGVLTTLCGSPPWEPSPPESLQMEKRSAGLRRGPT